MVTLVLAIVSEVFFLLVLRYVPITDQWLPRLGAAWFWSSYVVFVWAFLFRFAKRGSIAWLAGDGPWVIGLSVGALLMAFGLRWVRQRRAGHADELRSAFN